MEGLHTEKALSKYNQEYIQEANQEANQEYIQEVHNCK